jgi:hypothetical protein
MFYSTFYYYIAIFILIVGIEACKGYITFSILVLPRRTKTSTAVLGKDVPCSLQEDQLSAKQAMRRKGREEEVQIDKTEMGDP